MQLTFDEQIYVPDNEERVDAWSATYEKQDFDEVKKHIGKDSIRTVVDAGAHVGVWTRHLLGYAKAIHAFEPVPEHIECWKANLKDIKAKSEVTLNEVALSNKAGKKVTMYVPIGLGALSTLYAHEKKQRGAPTIKVSTATLDSFKLKNVDLIKVDIEGSDQAILELLEGGRETIAKNKPVLYVEVQPVPLFKAHTYITEELGYKWERLCGFRNICYYK